MTSTPLLLAGAGGFARETIELVLAVNRLVPTWQIVGLLDDDPSLHGRQIHGFTVLGPCEAVHDHPEALVSACVASPDDPMRRLRLVSRLGLPIERYATLVHPTAVVPASAVIGRGAVLQAASIMTADVELEAHVAVMPGVVLTHDVLVGEGATLAAGAMVAGAVTIERGAYVGSGALLRERVVVGSGSLIGMGAVVTRSVPADEVWVGVPARRCRTALIDTRDGRE